MNIGILNFESYSKVIDDICVFRLLDKNVLNNKKKSTKMNCIHLCNTYLVHGIIRLIYFASSYTKFVSNVHVMFVLFGLNFQELFMIFLFPKY